MTADVQLTPYQIGRAGFPYMWAPVFLREEPSPQYLHHPLATPTSHPFAVPHTHTPGFEAQAANVVAALRLRADHGGHMTTMRPRFAPYVNGTRIRLDAELTFEWDGVMIRRRGTPR